MKHVNSRTRKRPGGGPRRKLVDPRSTKTWGGRPGWGYFKKPRIIEIIEIIEIEADY